VAEWRASGQTQYEYCTGKSFSRHSLTAWSTRLRVLDSNKPGRSVEPKSPKQAKPTSNVLLARVVRPAADSSSKVAPTGGIVLESGALRVQLDVGCDRALVLSVIEALHR
jgi:hypothetical protein